MRLEAVSQERGGGWRLPGSALSSYHRGPTPPHPTPEGGRQKKTEIRTPNSYLSVKTGQVQEGGHHLDGSVCCGRAEAVIARRECMLE